MWQCWGKVAARVRAYASPRQDTARLRRSLEAHAPDVLLRRYESSAKMQRLPLGRGAPVQCCLRSNRSVLLESRVGAPFRIRAHRVSNSNFEEVLGGSAISKSNPKVSKSFEIVFSKKYQAKPPFRNGHTVWHLKF